MTAGTALEEILKSIDTSPLGKGIAFERAIKWWLRTDPSWANFFLPDSVELWQESKLANGPDIGIDLTAIDFLGRNWAIQVKNWRTDKPLPKAEIDKFLSASNSRTFHGRLLVTTTKEISRNAVRAIADQEKECIVVDYDALTTSDVWVDYQNPRPSSAFIEETTLYPFQVEAVSAIVKGFSRGEERLQLLMACGTGKTITAQRISESIESQLTVFLAPSLLLVQQARSSWLRRAKIKAGLKSLAVCSDQTVADDEFSSTTVDLPFHVTTDPQEISSFINLSGKKVIFSTYQSFAQLEVALISTGVSVDLVICDEAHKLAGSRDKELSKCLSSEALAKSRYLFMTATPRVYSLRRDQEFYDEQVLSMDDTKLFGRVGFNYSFGQAILDKRLAKFEVVIMPVTDIETRSQIVNRELYEVEGVTVDAEMLATHIGLAKAMNAFNIRRVISFHSSIRRAQVFSQFHSKVPKFFSDSFGETKLSTQVLTGKDSSRRRRQVLEDLAMVEKNEQKLVTNARCLTEGVDVPDLDGVAFIDSKSSQTDIVQAVGRAIRRGKQNKEVGYIILPVFISSKSLELNEIESDKFGHVVAVLNALKAHDENLVVAFGDLRYSLGRHGVIHRLPDGVSLQASRELPEAFFAKIQAYLVRSTSSSWNEYLGLLEQYVATHGGLNIPATNQSQDEKQLYTWIGSQRTQFRKGNLSSERIAKLESYKWWTWDPFDDSWRMGLAALSKHFKNGGSATVPRGFKVDGVNLFNWIRLHRNKSERLSPERRAQLEAFPQWRWSPFEEAWEERYQLLKATLMDGDDWSLSSLTATQRSSMREWIQYQRKHRNGRLRSWQIDKLEALPDWQWSDGRWNENFELLERYVNEFGTSRVSATTIFEGQRLGAWVSNERTRYKKGLQTQDRISQFERLPGWTWYPLSDDWKFKIESLTRYVAAHQLDQLSQDTTFEGWRIGEWSQKIRRSKESLTDDQISELELLPGWKFETPGDRKDREFDSKFAKLEKFVETFGTSQVPFGFVFEGFALGNWVRNRQSAMDKLRPDQRERLEALPFWGVDQFNIDLLPPEKRDAAKDLPFRRLNVSDEVWATNRAAVEAYLLEFRPVKISNRVVYQGLKIGSWLYQLRSAKPVLNPDQISWLEGLPGWSWGPKRASAWNTHYELMQEYVETNGTSRVPQGTKFKGAALGTWVHLQRQSRSKLSKEQMQALESLPKWSWNPLEDDWEAAFQVFEANPGIDFGTRESRTIKIEGINVANWLRTQRKNWDRLSPEKRARLQACPNWRP